jgi:outer membrane protein assembly factor BamB
VNKLIAILLSSLMFSCSLDTKSGIWTKDRDVEKIQIDEQKIFNKDKLVKNEFNADIKLELNDYKINLEKNINFNNTGRSEFYDDIGQISKFKFKKIHNFNQFEPDLVSDGSHFIFFDDKRNILKFDKNFELIWKKNFYTKDEKKNNPLLSFALSDNTLVVADTIGKIYNIDLNSGNVNWTKKNNNPFNSQIKIYNNKIFTVDLNNVVRCFSLKNGEELWKYSSENTFLKSDKRKSIAIKDNLLYFNNSIGDISALEIDDGSLVWQMPTQSNIVFENSFNMETSNIVISDDNLFFSNNRNEFYSISLNNGILNWKQNINSNVKPVIIENLIFSLSNEGFLFIIDKQTGNIIRITDIFKIFKPKKRKNINPIGFVIGKNNLIVSTNIGRLLIVDIISGKTSSMIKIDNNKISTPFVFDKNILLVKDNAVIKLN